MALTERQHTSHSSDDARAGKYLTFELAGEEYGIEILKVREIIGMMNITALPETPDYILGVINLRGKVIPVVDMRLKFAMPSAEQTAETCIIVLDVQGNLMGVQVDKVSEVLDIHSDELEDPPQIGGSSSAESILAMAKSKGRVKILLNTDKVLAEAELLVS